MENSPQKEIIMNEKIKGNILLLLLFILIGIPLFDHFILGGGEETKYTWMIISIVLGFVTWNYYQHFKKSKKEVEVQYNNWKFCKELLDKERIKNKKLEETLKNYKRKN